MIEVRRLPEHLLWCLACHKPGHRAQNCTEMLVDIPGMDAWNVTSGARLTYIRFTDEFPSVRRLLNLLSRSDLVNLEFNQHVERRDALLSVIYHEMTNWQSPLGHETWFHFMSLFHKIVYNHKIEIENILYRIRDRLDQCENDDVKDYLFWFENAQSFLFETLDCAGDEAYEEVEEIAEAICDDLRSTQEKFQQEFLGFVDDLESYLGSDPEILNFDPADSAWLCKAFWVLVGMQPSLDLSDLYVARWIYRDLDSILAYQELQI